MPTSFRQSTAILGLLLLVMGATRIHHFAAIPDASWAVFFVGGFYLHRQWRWTLPLLFAVAVLADAYAITAAGLDFWNHYCVSVAYWFLVPAYLSLWFGGRWLARHQSGLAWGSLATLTVSLLLSASLCYLISNGSFYWLSDSWGGAGAQRSLGGWLTNMGHWYGAFMKVTALYVGIVAVLHAGVLATVSGHRPETGRVSPR